MARFTKRDTLYPFFRFKSIGNISMNKIKFLKIIIRMSFVSFSPISLADQSVNNSPLLPAVSCRYEMKVTPHNKAKQASTNTWYFWRKPGMVQTLDADGDYGEIWEQTVTGHIHYRKLYHSDKTAVEYMPADNPTNNFSFDWRKLSTMLSPKELDTLKFVKKTQVLGHTAELRQGKIDGQNVTVQWLTTENLPASIIRKDQKNNTVELRLVEIMPLETAKRKPFANTDLANYRHIDAVDFGDMESDPFVKKIMAAEGHHHH